MTHAVQLISHDGTMTPDGEKVIQHVESVVRPLHEARDVNGLNNLGGSYKHYYQYVFTMQESIGAGGMTPTQWLRDVPTAAMNIWYDIQHLEEQEKQRGQTESNTKQTTKLGEQLEALREELNAKIEEQKQDITNLKRANTNLKKKLSETESAEQDDEPEADDTEEAEDGEA